MSVYQIGYQALGGPGNLEEFSHTESLGCILGSGERHGWDA